MWQIKKDTVITWYYWDGDEFNGTKMNTDKWISGYPWSKISIRDEVIALPENIEVNKGTLKFFVKKEKYTTKLQPWEIDTVEMKKKPQKMIDENWTFNYTTGLLWGKKRYKYGYFELRFKHSRCNGMWPAFWLYGGHPNYELDFFELKGEKNNCMHVDIHCPDGCSNFKEGPFGYRKAWGHWIKTTGWFDESFNTISGSWTPEGISWYLNGVLVACFDKKIDIPMELSTGIGPANDNGPFSQGPDKKSVFPGVLELDYLRIWKTDSINNNLELYFDADTTNLPDIYAGDQGSLKPKSRIINLPKNYKPDKDFITLSIIKESKRTYIINNLGGIQGLGLVVEIIDERGDSFWKSTNLPLGLTRIFLDNKKGKYWVKVKAGNRTISQELKD